MCRMYLLLPHRIRHVNLLLNFGERWTRKTHLRRPSKIQEVVKEASRQNRAI